jgi:hypothetical protein
MLIVCVYLKKNISQRDNNNNNNNMTTCMSAGSTIMT